MKTKTKIDTSTYLFNNKALVALIVPLIIEQLLAFFVGLVDSVMVASVGEAAVSGVSLVDSIMILLINVFAALATGGAVVAGQYLGQKRKEDASEASTQLVWFILLFSVVITIFVYLFRYPILHGVFGKISSDVMGHANIYLLIVIGSIPFIALYNGGAAVFRTMGNSKLPMQVAIIMNIINVSGNAILVYGFKMGTAGVAIPTLASRIFAGVTIIVLLCNEKRLIHIKKSFRYTPDLGMIKKILYIGVPNGLENSMFQLGKIIVLSLVSAFGTSAIAANAVSNAVALFQILPGVTISLAVTTVISRCVGAGDYVQVKYYIKKLMGITYIAMCVTNIIIFIALPFIMKLYNLSDLTAQTAENILILHGTCGMIIWPIAFVLPGIYRSCGDVKFSMLISISSMWIFRIVFSHILGKYFGLGVFGVWIAMIIDWCFRSICFILRYFSGKWKHNAVV